GDGRGVHGVTDRGGGLGERGRGGLRRHLDAPEHLGPAHLRVPVDDVVLHLGGAPPGLDLGVPGAGAAQPLLPAVAAGAGAPQEQLAAAQLVGAGLREAATVGLDRGDEAPGRVRLEEVVARVVGDRGVADVDVGAVGVRYLHAREATRVVGAPRRPGLAEDAGAGRLGDGDVRPVVERLGLGVGVDDARVRDEAV